VAISFGGVDLLLEDREGKIQDWLDRWLSTEDGRMIVEWGRPLKSDNYAGTTAEPYTGTGSPVLNYSRPQRPKINTWYQPTGCSRWSYGFFIADYTRLQSLPETGSLVLSSIGNTSSGQKKSSRSWRAYMLPCHALSSNAFAAKSLWLIPLVDERFYWQFAIGSVSPVYNAVSRTSKQWSDFINDIQSLFGSLTADDVLAAYLQPNYFALSGPGNYTLSTAMIDAFFHSVGLRLVPDYPAASVSTVFPGGQWKAINFDSSATIRDANLANTFDLGVLQGGEAGTIPGLSGILPANVVVYFRSWKNGITLADWFSTRYSKTVAAGGLSNYTKAFTSTALADYTSGGGTPDNQASLDALASQIATDFVASIDWVQDSVRIGISQWQESGFDDYIEFSPGYREPALEDYVPKTRIHTIPYNFSCETLFHYDPTTWEYGDRIMGTLDGNLAAGGTQTITVSRGDSPMTSDTIHLTITNLFNITGTTGQQILAVRMADKWVPVAKDCP
jgi:hypothetical protein